MRSWLINVGPVPVKAYKMYMVASGLGASPFLIVYFQRGVDNDRQDHYYTFGKGVKVKVSSDGTSGSIRAKLGAFGRISLNFSGTAGGAVVPLCGNAAVKQATGTLSGTPGMTLVSHSSYFGTVKVQRFPATTTLVSGTDTCKPSSSFPSSGTILVREPSRAQLHRLRGDTFNGWRDDRAVLQEDTSYEAVTASASCTRSTWPASALRFQLRG